MQRHKIVFGGTMGAGKSQAIAAISEIAVLSTETINTDEVAHSKLLTTVGIDYGEISLDADTRIGLYGTPGQARFNFIWPIIAKGALGVIILVDHTAPDPLQDLAMYIESFAQSSSNLIVGVTHVDLKPERPISIYRDWLQQYQHRYPIFFIDARVREDVLLLIETMIASLEVQFGGLGEA